MRLPIPKRNTRVYFARPGRANVTVIKDLIHVTKLSDPSFAL